MPYRHSSGLNLEGCGAAGNPLIAPPGGKRLYAASITRVGTIFPSRRNRDLTLTELPIVGAIVGILAAVLPPTFPAREFGVSKAGPFGIKCGKSDTRLRGADFVGEGQKENPCAEGGVRAGACGHRAGGVGNSI